MSRNYKFRNSEGVYFVSFAVVAWIDIFTRNDYKNIVIDALPRAAARILSRGVAISLKYLNLFNESQLQIPKS
ncbi:MAG: transposase, partial [Bacteroidetes bacterium]|nr:transposase [Bacteroidota bacterium]MBU1578481.1 transposase [Bacteroidota bacterium]